MSHTFNSTSKRSWLKDNHQKQKNRSIQLGKEAIDLLVNQGIPVTLETISDKSKEIDPSGRGIHKNTIRSNPELYDHYKQHSKTYKQKQKSHKSRFKQFTNVKRAEYQKLTLQRNLKNVENKYMSLTKKELVQRLIQAEQYIAEKNKIWITNQFELFK
ncbi:hypothetical protein [Chengkuizengella axinellae]|uniref:Transposase n=1 Tax=Chengkuizengella axinellae TaxID=3064388 RepID=A0ABT9J3L8_9BACL|nr:hypothetical protein [Chengkuizengella sp. 2205SS18-9]MDP5276200.1 hypothetical protein [Chengkuizengella sp. 2205SS18-9]